MEDIDEMINLYTPDVRHVFNSPFPDDYGNLIEPLDINDMSNSAFISRAYYFFPATKFHFVASTLYTHEVSQ